MHSWIVRVASIPMLLVGLVAADWPGFLGPKRNGIAQESELAVDWPSEGPKVVWRRSVGEGFSGPVIADDQLILFHRQGREEMVEALDPATGQSRWKFRYSTKYIDSFGFDEGPRATPLIANGRIYTLGAAGDLHALEAKTGKKLWAHNILRDYQVDKGFFGVGSSPLCVDNRLLMNVGGKGAGIVALDARTGKELWKATEDAASYASPVLATIQGKQSAVFLTRRGLVVLDPATGQVHYQRRWRPRTRTSVSAATPLVRDDRVFLSVAYQTGAILLQVGEKDVTPVWESDAVMTNHYNTPVLHKGHLYGIHGRQEAGAELACVDWNTGARLWAQPGFGCATLVKVGDQFLALTEQGELVVFTATPEAYRERARAPILSTTTRAAFAFSDGQVYARDAKQLIRVNLRKKR